MRVLVTGGCGFIGSHLVDELVASGHSLCVMSRAPERCRPPVTGVEYRFASAANLAAFRASPSRYLPSYGGYCAWAISQGYTASADPTNWRIVDGRLYLNYNDEIQRRWEQDIPARIREANANWPSVLSR